MTQKLTHPSLTHLDANGDIAMVDVADKTITKSTAAATGKVIFPPDIYQAIKTADGQTRKGSITQTAHIAGVMAAKRTHELIPLCHQLPLDGVKIGFEYDDSNHAIMQSSSPPPSKSPIKQAWKWKPSPPYQWPVSPFMT